VSDIFREVDEEVRREQLRRMWERYGFLIIAGAVLIVALVGGWRAYDFWETKKATEAGTRFEAAIQLSEQGKTEEAEAAFAKLAAEGTGTYRGLAKLREAAETAKRDPKAAVAIYDSIASDSSLPPALRELATLRAGFLLVDEAPYEDLRKRLEPLTGANSGFRHSAHMLLALSAWRNNDVAAARRWAEMILGDAEAPSSTRAQAEMLQTLTAGDGKS